MGSGQGDPRACRPSCRSKTGQVGGNTTVKGSALTAVPPRSDHADRAAGGPGGNDSLDGRPRHNLELSSPDSVEPDVGGAQEMGSGQGDPRACRPSCRGETGHSRGGTTVKCSALTAVPPGVTTLIGPLVAPEGTTASMLVPDTTSNSTALTPLNKTSVAPRK